MRTGTILAATMAVAFIAVATAGYLLVDDQRTTLPEAPNFALASTGYENGTLGQPVNFTLQDYRGKTVVLDFMAVTCATCRIVTNEVLKPLQGEYGSRDDFVILSVDVWASDAFGQAAGETREGLVALQQSENTTWRHALDTEGLIQKYGAIGIPLLTVIDPDGRIVYQNSGMPQRNDVTQAVEASMAGTASQARILQAGIPALAMLAGLAAVLTPCSVGLLPGYIGNLAKTRPEIQDGLVRPFLAAGVLASLGVIALYAILAGLLLVIGAPLRDRLDLAGPIVGAAMIAVGIASLAGLPWNRLVPARLMQAPKAGFFGYGVAYGAAAFGCTGPIFLPLMLTAFLVGPAFGLVTFAAYSLGVAVLLMAIAYLIAAGHLAGLQRILPRASRLTMVANLLMVAAGAYLIWFYYRAGVLPWQ
ncbi:MAG: redoxin family protein [Thermoplasmatota archaeon]